MSVPPNLVVSPGDRVDAELLGVMCRSVKELQAEHQGKNYISYFDIVWIAKSLEAAGYKKTPEEAQELPAGVTDREKVEFMLQKVIWERRKRLEATHGRLCDNWTDMERKARLMLNEFGKHLPGEVKGQILVNMMALFMDSMFKWGKWEQGKSIKN